MKKAVMCVPLMMCVLAAAQEKPKSSGAAKPAEKKTSGGAGQMSMAKPSPMMQKLSKMMIGTWSTSEKHEPSPWAPNGATGKGTAVFKHGPGGLSLLEDYRSTSGLGTFAGHGVIWWDDKAGGYKSTWCDSMTPAGCEVSNGLAKWEGDSLVGTNDTEMMGQKFTLKETWSDITPNSFTFSMDGGAPGGEMKHMMTIKYTRTGATKTEAKKP